MFTNHQLVAFVLEVYKNLWVYWYGTCGYKCSQSLYESKAKQYPSHYTAGRKAGYQADIKNNKMAADCVGMIKAFFWMGGKLDGKNVYKANNCPDVSADGMIKLCTETGPISTIPDIPGLVVWKTGHIGVYIGNGETIEMRGFDYDCVRRAVNKGPWTKWGKLPASMLQYVKDEPEPAPEPEKPTDYNVRITDGTWYVRVKPDKNAKSLGVVKKDEEYPFIEEVEYAPWEKIIYKGETAYISARACEIVPKKKQQYIEVKGTWYVRAAANKNAAAVGSVKTGDKAKYLNILKDGWYAIEYNGLGVWISEKAGKIVQ